MARIKKFGKAIAVSAVLGLICVILGILLLRTVYQIPVWDMEWHMQASAQTLEREYAYHNLFPWCSSKLDNYTDSLMLITAAHNTGEDALHQAMRIPIPTIGDLSYYECLLAHNLEGQHFDGIKEYGRYWHGYLVFLKPLLLFLDYEEIRTVNAVMQTALLGIVLYLMEKKGLKRFIFPYLIGYAFLAPTVLAHSLQFASCYYVMNLCAIAVLLLKREHLVIYAPYVFLLAGIATVYLDLLTYPVITLGVPAVLYCCRRGRMPIGTALKEGANICALWFCGYVGMWASKWVISSVILNRDMIQNALSQILFRTSMGAEQADAMGSNILRSLGMNIKEYVTTPVSLIAFGMVLVLLFRIVKKIREQGVPKGIFTEIFPYLVLACVPFLWYIGASNHSIYHWWFTNKAMMTTSFAILCAMTRVSDLLDKENDRTP